MSKLNTGTIALIALAIILGFAAPAEARNNHGHRGGGHHNYGYRSHHNSYNHGYRKHHYSGHHGYGYLATGLVLGAAFNSYANQPRYVERRTVVYRQPVYTQNTVVTPIAAPISANAAPEPRPDYYLRKDRDGECWLVENTEEGEQIITPQSPEVCG